MKSYLKSCVQAGIVLGVIILVIISILVVIICVFLTSQSGDYIYLISLPICFFGLIYIIPKILEQMDRFD